MTEFSQSDQSSQAPLPPSDSGGFQGRKLLTKKELAVRYGVVPRTIDYWIARRQIPYLKLGRKLVRFDPEECDKALQRFKVSVVF
jgi:excisionase family DNA binding protein